MSGKGDTTGVFGVGGITAVAPPPPHADKVTAMMKIWIAERK